MSFARGSVVTYCYWRQTTFRLHPCGKVFDKARKGWPFYNRFIQTFEESEPFSRNLNKQLTGPFQCMGMTTAALPPGPSITCYSNLFRCHPRFGRNIQHLDNLEKLPGNTQEGFMCAALLCTMPNVAISLFIHWWFLVTGNNGRVLEQLF